MPGRFAKSAGDGDLLRRALGYPYWRPRRSFIVASDGEVRPWDGRAADGRERIAVLAVGSNAAPYQLCRKFLGRPEFGPGIPVLAGSIEDAVPCHAAHITAYGAIAACLAPMRGASAAVHATLLTRGQLARMNETEAVGTNYVLDPTDARLLGETGEVLAPLLHYRCLHGCLRQGGEPLPLDRHAQHAVQRLAAEICGFGGTLEDWVKGNVLDAGLRAARRARLIASAGCRAG